VAVRRLLRIAWFVLVTVLAVSVFRFAPVSAGVSFQPPSPEELGMTSEPQAPGAPAIILFREVDRDDNGRTSHEDNYFRIKILTEEGRKYADIEIPFFKGSENIVNIKARTIRPDGSIVNFDGNVFDKSIVKSKGFRYLAKTFTLPDVQVGGIIEYSYTRDLQEYFIFDSHWILSADLFTKECPVLSEALHQPVSNLERPLDMAQPAAWNTETERGIRSRNPPGGPQHTCLSAGRLHAAARRGQGARGFHLQRRGV